MPVTALPHVKFTLIFLISGSLSSLIAPIGAILIGIIIDKFGRRTALLFTILPNVIGWFLLYCDISIPFVFLGLLFTGIASGTVGYPSQVYAGECLMVNRVSWRNNYLSWLGLSFSFGMCFVLVLGYFFRYQQIAGFATILSVLSFLSVYFFIPESPSWLYMRGRVGDAEWSQKKLRISQPILRTDQTIENDILPIENTNFFHWPTIKLYASKCTRRDVYKPLLIMTGLFFLLTFTGGVAVMTYLVDVINSLDVPASASISNSSAEITSSTSLSESYKYSAIGGLVMLTANISVCALVKSLGTRNILVTSSLLLSIGFLLLGYTSTRTGTASDVIGLHVIAVYLILFSFNFGIMNLPNALLGDMFPIDAKGYASVVCVIEFLLTSLLLKIHPYMITAFGGYLYYGYAGVSLCSAVYIATFLVETVGKTLRQINEEFR